MMQKIQHNMFPVSPITDSTQIRQRLLWWTRLTFHSGQQITYTSQWYMWSDMNTN